GRPSTYASIIGTIIDRGYVDRINQQLVPTFTAFAVTTLLERHFPHLVDTRFTAGMEDRLDEIAEGEAAWLPYLQEFFTGPEGLGDLVQKGEAEIDPREASTVFLEGLPGRVRIGRFGPFVEREENGATVTASLPDGTAPGDLTGEQVDRLVRAKTEGPDVLGTDPETGKPVLMLQGRFGPYVQLGEATEEEKKPKRASLPKGMNPGDVSLEAALRWLSLPRTLGKHPDDGEEVRAGIGRFGPFVVHGNDFRSLEKTDDVYTVGLGRALELLSKPKGGRGARKTIEPLRTLGAHPADGEPVTLWEGRYGPYVKHGDVNASLPKGVSPDAFTLEQAVPLLAERALTAKPKRGRAGARRGAAKTARSTGRTAKAGDTKASAAKKPAAKPKSKTAASVKKTAAKKPAPPRRKG
ncbi:MAG: topoisomerase C-terminal repeat-containing protein, partial [Longimicrobiaceae bacterium]